MPEVSWRTLMREHPSAHLVIGVIPSPTARDSTNPGIKTRLTLMARLAGSLRLTGMYALKDTPERDGNHVHVALGVSSDAEKLATAVGAMGTGRDSGGASQRSFRFDDDAADGMAASLQQFAASSARRTRKRRTSFVL